MDEDPPHGTGLATDGKGKRAATLLKALRQSADLARAQDWRGTVIIRNGELLVEQDGPLFHARDEARFFRKLGRGIALPMRKRLKERGLTMRTVFDVGANIGEVAMSFAWHYPKARVFAFEPAPENLSRLDANVALQPERLANLTVVREAMSDRQGQIDIAVGAQSLNTVMLEANLERLTRRAEVQVVSVPTDTLENYCARFEVKEIDFLKVDTEGGEPLLSASVRHLAGRIHAALVEISRFNTIEAYLELVDAFAAGGLAMEDNDGAAIADPKAHMEAELRRLNAINAWFLPRR